MTVDFHCHSTASDGTFTPTELAQKGAAFAAMAITDHDNCDGADEFLAFRSDRSVASPLRVAGIELSIEPGEGFDKFHLLGLGINPADAGLRAFLRRILDGRNARNERILANFRRLGIEMADPDCPRQPSIALDSSRSTAVDGNRQQSADSSRQPSTALDGNRTIFSYAHGEVLARPHFARWLVDHGHARDIPDAFERYLLADSPAETRCYEERWHPSQEEAFAVIHAAGGVCVMAHPRYWRDSWKRVGCDFAAAERGLAALKEKGLDGVEALYQANTGEENVEFVRIATKLGYLKSAGSDFHGSNKAAIPLGMEVSEAYIQPLLERLK